MKIKEIIEVGKEIDLSDCWYGITFYNQEFLKAPSPEYYFLAGFVKSMKLRNILELGTHYGGSISSMYKATEGKGKLVTIDINNLSNKRINPNIIKIKGSSFDRKTIKKVFKEFKEVDLIYFDSIIRFKSVLENIRIYTKLNPKYLIINAIFYNDSMKKLWDKLTKEFKDRAHIVEIEDKPSGLGIIEWRR